MKRKWKHWAICAAIVAAGAAGASAAHSQRSPKCACSGASVTGNRPSAWKQWAICAAIVAGSVAGGRLLRAIHDYQLLNLRALNARFVPRGTAVCNRGSS